MISVIVMGMAVVTVWLSPRWGDDTHTVVPRDFHLGKLQKAKNENGQILTVSEAHHRS